MTADKKLLMLACSYPPVYGGHTERSVKFVKYLPDHGWTPVVITKSAPGNGSGKGAKVGAERVVRTPDILVRVRERARTREGAVGHGDGGEKTAQAMPLGRRLKRLAFDLADKWLVVPDWQVGWAATAFAPSLRILRRGEADVIYSTSPPASSHLLGLALKRATGKPWVMDYRDPWTFEPVNKQLRRPGFRLSLERRLEWLCVAGADAVIANTPRAERRFKALYPRFAGKFRVITNGFDGEELERAASSPGGPTPWKSPGDGVFVISHAGDFYRFRQGDRTPHSLLNALKDLLDEGIISPETCRVILAGELPPVMLRRITRLGLEGLIESVGLISHLDATRLMLVSDLLLLFDPSGDGGTYVRSKLYEYLGGGRPVLGMVPEGASRELLAISGRGLLTSPDDREGIKLAIRRAIEHPAPPVSRSGFDPSNYDRRELTKRLASLLDGLLVR